MERGRGARVARRLSRLAPLILVLALVPIVAVALVQIFPGREEAPSASDRRRGIAGGPRLSSPVDPDARFPWEITPPPKSLIPLEEIVSGGPPPDGIPPIDAPAFETPQEAAGWLEGPEPVLAFEQAGEARAYPIRILTWHEIVNDVVAGVPISVTFCPLCNSAMVFDRRAADLVLDFGTSGRLYRSDLVMYDRQTKSLWPQIEGRAVAGRLIRTELKVLPSAMVSWNEWRAANPRGLVLSRDTGFDRDYGTNPYAGYDSLENEPSFFTGETDGRLRALERVLALRSGNEAKAYPFKTLARRSPTVVRDRLAGREVVIFFRKGTASALDTSDIASGRDVGATGVFVSRLGDRALDFEARGGEIVDRQTGTRWTVLGRATSGPLKGRKLQPVEHIDTFWFAWAAFEPDTVIWRG